MIGSASPILAALTRERPEDADRFWRPSVCVQSPNPMGLYPARVASLAGFFCAFNKAATRFQRREQFYTVCHRF